MAAGTSISDSTLPSDSPRVNSRVRLADGDRPLGRAATAGAAGGQGERHHAAERRLVAEPHLARGRRVPGMGVADRRRAPGSRPTPRRRGPPGTGRRPSRSRSGARSAGRGSGGRAGSGSSRTARARRPSRSGGTAAASATASSERDRDAEDRVRVPAEVLGRRVEHDVGAELERPLEGGRREGVVDDDQRRRLARLRRAVADGRGRRRDVGDLEQRVRRRLEPDEARRARSGPPTARPRPSRGRRTSRPPPPAGRCTRSR